jgi:diacylglycerol kinase family enzyme
MEGTVPIPAFVNAGARRSEGALATLSESDAFDVVEAKPDELFSLIRQAVEAGVSRVVVAGGDGTIATAAGAVAGSSTELAVLPVGTLNHFAKDHDLTGADANVARLADATEVRLVDIARVNGRAFVNTSSVGAYVVFVRTRERLERRFGYTVASLVAAVRVLGRVRPFEARLLVDGVERRFRTSLVFVGVGERELRVPIAGGRVKEGRRGLHVMIVRGGTAARLVALGLMGLARGLRRASRSPIFETFITDRVELDLPRPRGNVSVDGELVRMTAPLCYELVPDAVRLVVG